MVDDLIPIDVDGRPLLPCSGVLGELWPLLVCKAICKLVTFNRPRSHDEEGELGDAQVLHMLTSWMPETLSLVHRCAKFRTHHWIVSLSLSLSSSSLPSPLPSSALNLFATQSIFLVSTCLSFSRIRKLTSHYKLYSVFTIFCDFLPPLPLLSCLYTWGGWGDGQYALELSLLIFTTYPMTPKATVAPYWV